MNHALTHTKSSCPTCDENRRLILKHRERTGCTLVQAQRYIENFSLFFGAEALLERVQNGAFWEVFTKQQKLDSLQQEWLRLLLQAGPDRERPLGHYLEELGRAMAMVEEQS